jgi:hypothetical protein
MIFIPSALSFFAAQPAVHAYSYQTAVDQISTLFKNGKIIQPAAGTKVIQRPTGTLFQTDKTGYQLAASYLMPDGKKIEVFVFAETGKPSYTVNDFYVNNLGFANLTKTRTPTTDLLATFIKDGIPYYLEYRRKFAQ